MFASSRLVILLYHRVLPTYDPLRHNDITADAFGDCMKALKRFFNVLPLEEAVVRLQAGELPPLSVCVTFDDGYADNLEIAGPILADLELPATVFIATGFLDGGVMWNDIVIEAVRGASGPSLELGSLGTFSIGSMAERQECINRVLKALKPLPPDERQEQVEFVAARSTVDIPRDFMLSSGQVSQLASAGIAVGAHTDSHPILASLSSEAAYAEITSSKGKLERLTGRPVNTFAYPNGRPGIDYRAEDVEAVKRAGFSVALSTAWGSARRDSDPFQLPRIGPWDTKGWKLSLRVLATYFQ